MTLVRELVDNNNPWSLDSLFDLETGKCSSVGTNTLWAAICITWWTEKQNAYINCLISIFVCQNDGLLGEKLPLQPFYYSVLWFITGTRLCNRFWPKKVGFMCKYGSGMDISVLTYTRMDQGSGLADREWRNDVVSINGPLVGSTMVIWQSMQLEAFPPTSPKLNDVMQP